MDPDVFSNIEFEGSSKNTRIQVADMFARESMKAMDNLVGPTKRPIRKSLQTLKATRRFVVDGISTDYFSSMKQQFPEMQKRADMSPEAYVQWLNDREFSDTMSNRLAFLEWKHKQERVSGK
jgi:hypothetical protein